MSNPPEPVPLPPRRDDSAADIGSLVDMGQAEPQPEPAPADPPAPEPEPTPEEPAPSEPTPPDAA
ncbi:hypothetical protein ACF1BS_03100 [Streptomyces sp. NPDC014748]|uniref:hypothetical protein n=1 Tax=Streptomyces sp. NPDC014748 TaxID=3364905 RepID=UPI0036F8DF3D